MSHPDLDKTQEKTFGWNFSDPLVLQIPNPHTKVNYAGKRGMFYFTDDLELPSGWDHAQRKIAEGTFAYEKPTYLVYDANEPVDASLFTGRVGTITYFSIVSDRFVEHVVRKSKYVYALTKGKDNRGRHIVLAYLYERDNPEKTYWYKFRSARLAHRHMKKYDTAKLGWKNHE